MQNVIALENLAMVFSNFLIICLKKPNPGKAILLIFWECLPFWESQTIYFWRQGPYGQILGLYLACNWYPATLFEWLICINPIFAVVM